MKKINIQGDINSRRAIANSNHYIAPVEELVKPELKNHIEDGDSKEVHGEAKDQGGTPPKKTPSRGGATKRDI